MTDSTTKEQLIEEQQATLILLRSWFSDQAELHNPAGLEDAFLADPFDPNVQFGDSLSLELNLTLDPSSPPIPEHSVTLRITLALTPHTPKADVELGRAALSRADQTSLCEALRPIGADEGSGEYVFEMILKIQENIQRIQDEQQKITAEGKQAEDRRIAGNVKGEKWERVWFWFPSLSSKEKRRDLVTFAHDAGLTGFVLAGKPGLLCVEGDGGEIDVYMGRIKSESWSDIPSYQKKVTERLRNPLPSASNRLLPRMIDITDSISHYGQYAHRPEMGEVKKQMQVWGVEEEWAEVVMGPGGGGALAG